MQLFLRLQSILAASMQPPSHRRSPPSFSPPAKLPPPPGEVLKEDVCMGSRPTVLAERNHGPLKLAEFLSGRRCPVKILEEKFEDLKILEEKCGFRILIIN